MQNLKLDPEFEHLRTWCSLHGEGYAMYYDAETKTQHLLHRYITECKQGFTVDHKDGDRLNNRLDNLRVCSYQENNYNTPTKSNNTSGYKGVYKSKATKKNKKIWHAYIKAAGMRMSLGYYETAQEAAIVYNKAAILWHGEFARLNDVQF